MGIFGRSQRKRAELEDEAASIEYSVRFAEQIAREGGVGDRAIAEEPIVSSEIEESQPTKKRRLWGNNDLEDEAASIEYSVRLTERMARAGSVEDRPRGELTRPTKKHEPEPRHIEEPPVSAAGIEHSVRLTERMARDIAIEECPSKERVVHVSQTSGVKVVSTNALKTVKGSLVWPKLTGRTSRELQYEAKYLMYLVYEQYPDEIKKLAFQIIENGCADLDEKGAKSFVDKVWANKRLQENLQGAMNATYYRELFEAEEKRYRKRSIPEIYLDGENPQMVFARMKTFLFKNMDLANGIHLLKNKKSRVQPLQKQLLDIFMDEKKKSLKRMEQ
ncbi:MAG TPA: hypothetical protein VK436_12510 [Methanocella sp.]|nr:hypothetical protein [Methanocella sp.]